MPDPKPSCLTCISSCTGDDYGGSNLGMGVGFLQGAETSPPYVLGFDKRFFIFYRHSLIMVKRLWLDGC